MQFINQWSLPGFQIHHYNQGHPGVSAGLAKAVVILCHWICGYQESVLLWSLSPGLGQHDWSWSSFRGQEDSSDRKEGARVSEGLTPLTLRLPRSFIQRTDLWAEVGEEKQPCHCRPFDKWFKLALASSAQPEDSTSTRFSLGGFSLRFVCVYVCVCFITVCTQTLYRKIYDHIPFLPSILDDVWFWQQ